MPTDDSGEEELESEGLDVGDEPEPFASVEEKYRKQMRQIFPQKIELPISTISDMIARQMNLSPDFQRRGIWTNERRSRFIESIIMNVPIPPVFLGEDDYGKYVVLDGRQRLTAINEFLANNYALEKLRVWSEFNGKRFNDLKRDGLETTFTRRFVPAVLILKESSVEVKYDVFDRLNTGGVIATAMEIRNAVSRGGFTDLLTPLSENQTFRRLWDIPDDKHLREENKVYNRMEDKELVLRFFALQQPQAYRDFSGTFRDYLTKVLESRNAAYRDKAAASGLAQRDQAVFERAVNNSFRVFGADAFRKPTVDGRRTVKSAPLADALMHALSDVDTARITDSVAGEIRDKIRDLCLNDNDFKSAIGRGTNGRSATELRLKRAADAVGAALK
ncbi:MAG: DUF262 domain-containing protein [Sandaracinaceae bacterium]|nr:DUF262 domain-containing protein [Sandaracinaceae bacterium]